MKLGDECITPVSSFPFVSHDKWMDANQTRSTITMDGHKPGQIYNYNGWTQTRPDLQLQGKIRKRMWQLMKIFVAFP